MFTTDIRRIDDDIVCVCRLTIDDQFMGDRVATGWQVERCRSVLEQ